MGNAIQQQEVSFPMFIPDDPPPTSKRPPPRPPAPVKAPAPAPPPVPRPESKVVPIPISEPFVRQHSRQGSRSSDFSTDSGSNKENTYIYNGHLGAPTRVSDAFSQSPPGLRTWDYVPDTMLTGRHVNPRLKAKEAALDGPLPSLHPPRDINEFRNLAARLSRSPSYMSDYNNPGFSRQTSFRSTDTTLSNTLQNLKRKPTRAPTVAQNQPFQRKPSQSQSVHSSSSDTPLRTKKRKAPAPPGRQVSEASTGPDYTVQAVKADVHKPDSQAPPEPPVDYIKEPIEETPMDTDEDTLTRDGRIAGDDDTLKLQSPSGSQAKSDEDTSSTLTSSTLRRNMMDPGLKDAIIKAAEERAAKPPVDIDSLPKLAASPEQEFKDELLGAYLERELRRHKNELRVPHTGSNTYRLQAAENVSPKPSTSGAHLDSDSSTTEETIRLNQETGEMSGKSENEGGASRQLSLAMSPAENHVPVDWTPDQDLLDEDEDGNHTDNDSELTLTGARGEIPGAFNKLFVKNQNGGKRKDEKSKIGSLRKLKKSMAIALGSLSKASGKLKGKNRKSAQDVFNDEEDEIDSGSETEGQKGLAYYDDRGRLVLLPQMERVVVLEDGRIVRPDGSELKKKGKGKKLVRRKDEKSVRKESKSKKDGNARSGNQQENSDGTPSPPSIAEDEDGRGTKSDDECFRHNSYEMEDENAVFSDDGVYTKRKERKHSTVLQIDDNFVLADDLPMRTSSVQNGSDEEDMDEESPQVRKKNSKLILVDELDRRVSRKHKHKIVIDMDKFKIVAKDGDSRTDSRDTLNEEDVEKLEAFEQSLASHNRMSLEEGMINEGRKSRTRRSPRKVSNSEIDGGFPHPDLHNADRTRRSKARVLTKGMHAYYNSQTGRRRNPVYYSSDEDGEYETDDRMGAPGSRGMSLPPIPVHTPMRIIHDDSGYRSDTSYSVPYYPGLGIPAGLNNPLMAHAQYGGWGNASFTHISPQAFAFQSPMGMGMGAPYTTTVPIMPNLQQQHFPPTVVHMAQSSPQVQPMSVPQPQYQTQHQFQVDTRSEKHPPAAPAPQQQQQQQQQVPQQQQQQQQQVKQLDVQPQPPPSVPPPPPPPPPPPQSNPPPQANHIPTPIPPVVVSPPPPPPISHVIPPVQAVAPNSSTSSDGGSSPAPSPREVHGTNPSLPWYMKPQGYRPVRFNPMNSKSSTSSEPRSPPPPIVPWSKPGSQSSDTTTPTPANPVTQPQSATTPEPAMAADAPGSAAMPMESARQPPEEGPVISEKLLGDQETDNVFSENEPLPNPADWDPVKNQSETTTKVMANGEAVRDTAVTMETKMNG